MTPTEVNSPPTEVHVCVYTRARVMRSCVCACARMCGACLCPCVCVLVGVCPRICFFCWTLFQVTQLLEAHGSSGLGSTLEQKARLAAVLRDHAARIGFGELSQFGSSVARSIYRRYPLARNYTERKGGLPYSLVLWQAGSRVCACEHLRILRGFAYHKCCCSRLSLCVPFAGLRRQRSVWRCPAPPRRWTNRGAPTTSPTSTIY